MEFNSLVREIHIFCPEIKNSKVTSVEKPQFDFISAIINIDILEYTRFYYNRCEGMGIFAWKILLQYI